ncbi:MAG: hypothetical protein HZA91_02700 [Verrucomicrobia bacterium]|nr:hypothetical protein [Verrucomicrobiota bacterium]
MLGSRLFWVIVLALAASYYFGPHPFKGAANPFSGFNVKDIRILGSGGFTTTKPSNPASTHAPAPGYGRLGDGDPNPAPIAGRG